MTLDISLMVLKRPFRTEIFDTFILSIDKGVQSKICMSDRQRQDKNKVKGKTSKSKRQTSGLRQTNNQCKTCQKDNQYSIKIDELIHWLDFMNRYMRYISCFFCIRFVILRHLVVLVSEHFFEQ